MPYQRGSLTLLEGKWFPNRNVSVRDLFQPLFTVWSAHGDSSYHYEMFTTESAFRSAVAHSFEPGHAQTVYVAAHGNRYSIHGFHDEGISRAKVRNALRAVRGTVARGLYFGSCLFGTRSNAEFILEGCQRVSWMAGYTGEVDWIDSSALDLYFLRHFLYPTPGRGHKRPRKTTERLRYAVSQVAENMAALASKLGFHVYVRKRGGGISDLVDRELQANRALQSTPASGRV